MNTSSMDQSAVNNFMQLEIMKSNIRLQEDAAKQENKAQRQLALFQQKCLLKEKEQERKKAQSELVSIDEYNGTVTVTTQNMKINAQARCIVNFSYPEIVTLRRLENENEKIFLFGCNIGQEFQQTMLAEDRCSSPTYLLRKLQGIGGQVLTPSLAKGKEYIFQLITLLILNSKQTIWLPDHHGWYRDHEGAYQFFENYYTWEEAIACTK